MITSATYFSTLVTLFSRFTRQRFSDQAKNNSRPLKLKLWTADHDRNTLLSWWTVPLDVGTYKQCQSTTAYLIATRLNFHSIFGISFDNIISLSLKTHGQTSNTREQCSRNTTYFKVTPPLQVGQCRCESPITWLLGAS